jgi:hypothetical protein
VADAGVAVEFGAAAEVDPVVDHAGATGSVCDCVLEVV